MTGAGAGEMRNERATETSIAGRLLDAARFPEERRELGSFIGRFEVVRLLGRGRLGAVYEARDSELGRHVALKLMRTDPLGASDRAALLEIFRGEAEAAARLNHPNVVTIHDHGADGDVPYLVLELVDGETLARRLARGPLSPADAIAISTQVCRGLVHAHGAGVIHRNLKPSTRAATGS